MAALAALSTVSFTPYIVFYMHTPPILRKKIMLFLFASDIRIHTIIQQRASAIDMNRQQSGLFRQKF